jgi:hypothetical protein
VQHSAACICSDGYHAQQGHPGVGASSRATIVSLIRCPKPPTMDGEGIAKVVEVINNL